MPFDAPRIVALLLGLAGLQGEGPTPTPRLPAPASIAVDEADVFDEPLARSFVSGALPRGTRVEVVAIEPAGWLAIAPPEGSFGWIDPKTLDLANEEGPTARVIAARAVLRSGHPDARLPGPPWVVLGKGAVVRLLDRPPLKVGGTTWRAIAPPDGARRHLRAESVAWEPEPEPKPEPAQETRAAFAPPAGPVESAPPAPADVAQELARIEASHQAILRGSIESWQLDSIRERYEALLRRVTDSVSGNVIRARLDEVARQTEVAQAARTIDAILDKSRRRDFALARFRRKSAVAESAQERPYDEQGMIQPSSRKVDGQTVYALIGPEGTTLAYLDIPPGLDPRPLLVHRVGVRGSVHYDETLRARLITVRDLEPLDAENANHRIAGAERKSSTDGQR